MVCQVLTWDPGLDPGIWPRFSGKSQYAPVCNKTVFSMLVNSFNFKVVSYYNVSWLMDNFEIEVTIYGELYATNKVFPILKGRHLSWLKSLLQKAFEVMWPPSVFCLPGAHVWPESGRLAGQEGVRAHVGEHVLADLLNARSSSTCAFSNSITTFFHLDVFFTC